MIFNEPLRHLGPFNTEGEDMSKCSETGAPMQICEYKFTVLEKKLDAGFATADAKVEKITSAVESLVHTISISNGRPSLISRIDQLEAAAASAEAARKAARTDRMALWIGCGIAFFTLVLPKCLGWVAVAAKAVSVTTP